MPKPLRYKENDIVNDIFRFVEPGPPDFGRFVCLLCNNPAVISVQYSNIRRMKSCGRKGCRTAPVKPRRIDYVGQVFNCLRVLKFIGKGQGLYEMQGVCGEVKVLRIRDVIAEKQKTCGDDVCTASLRADKDWRGDVCAAAKAWHAAKGDPDSSSLDTPVESAL
jgi:hypothetical protein